ncbi:CAP domain-containing protein [Longibacter salinarum]|nr:CAP domain-containing protein [Longibacter salinarum]
MSLSCFQRILIGFCTACLVTWGLTACGNLNMRCDGGGKGGSCYMVDGPPDRHTRTAYQPPWSDEYHDLADRRSDVNEHLLEVTNETRQKEGIPVVKEDPTLAQNACWHNQDMIAHNYLGHNDSDDRMPWDRVQREHRRLIGEASENAHSRAATSGRAPRDMAEMVVDSWMKSPGHRETLMEAKWTHLGVCLSESEHTSRATQVFARVQAYLADPLPWAMAPGESTTVRLSLVVAERKPTRYAFVPVGQPTYKTFRRPSAGQPFDGTLTVPSTTGTYELHVQIPDDDGGAEAFKGPRVEVTSDGEPTY